MKNINRMAAALEAFLFIKGHPVLLKEMIETLKEKESDIRKALEVLQSKYNNTVSGITLHETGAGWAIVTKKEYDAWLTEMVGETDKISSAALETLAVIASKEPVTRSEIERIRGVSVGRVLSVLLHKGLVEERGRMNIPGRPILYGTTQLFLKCTGLSDVHELREKWNSLPKEGLLF